MDQYAVEQSSLTKVANAIRGMGGTEEPLEFPDGFVNAIYNLEGGGGGLQKVLLWENASPTSSFTEQTIPLNLSEYSAAVVHCGSDTVLVSSPEITIGKTADIYNFSEIGTDTNAVGISMRKCTVTSTGVTIGNCYNKELQCGVSGTLQNSYLKPQKIYGIKGVIE